MIKERMMILEMLESGKITPAEAKTLLRALGDTGDVLDGLADEPAPQREGWPEAGQPHYPQPGRHFPPPAPAAPPHPAHPALTYSRRRRYPDPSYVVAMKRAGVTFTPEQLFRLQDHDIQPDQAAALLAVRRQEWSLDELVEMLTHEVTPALVLKLHDLGLGSLSPHQIIRLAEEDVDPDYLDRLKTLDLSGLTANDLVEFAAHDVDPDVARALMEIGPVTPGDIIRAADHDVSASYARRIAQLLPGVTVRQLVELTNHDVSPRYIEALVEAGFIDLNAPYPVRDIVRLSNHDVDPDDAAWFRATLGEAIRPQDLVHFANHDVTRAYAEPLLAYNLPGLDKDTLIEMARNDVSAADVALAREAYGDDLTAFDLIKMVKNR